MCEGLSFTVHKNTQTVKIIRCRNTRRGCSTGDLCFLSNLKYAAQAEKTLASRAIFVKAGTAIESNAVLIPAMTRICDLPMHLRYLEAQYNPRTGQNTTAIIDATAKVDPTAIIATAAIIEGDVEIGPHTYIGCRC